MKQVVGKDALNTRINSMIYGVSKIFFYIPRPACWSIFFYSKLLEKNKT